MLFACCSGKEGGSSIDAELLPMFPQRCAADSCRTFTCPVRGPLQDIAGDGSLPAPGAGARRCGGQPAPSGEPGEAQTRAVLADPIEHMKAMPTNSADATPKSPSVIEFVAADAMQNGGEVGTEETPKSKPAANSAKVRENLAECAGIETSAEGIAQPSAQTSAETTAQTAVLSLSGEPASGETTAENSDGECAMSSMSPKKTEAVVVWPAPTMHIQHPRLNEAGCFEVNSDGVPSEMPVIPPAGALVGPAVGQVVGLPGPPRRIPKNIEFIFGRAYDVKDIDDCMSWASSKETRHDRKTATPMPFNSGNKAAAVWRNCKDGLPAKIQQAEVQPGAVPHPPMFGSINESGVFNADPHTDTEPVLIQVYESHWLPASLGLPIYHVGIEVFGMEVSYGDLGVRIFRPGTYNTSTYREALPIGFTPLDKLDVVNIIKSMAEDWHGDEYRLIGHNCQTFVVEFCLQLGLVKSDLPPDTITFA